jgi:Protein of unknown function, DUF481
MKLNFIILFFLAFFFNINAIAQSGRLKVFMDCQSDCDMNYIRTEINIVDFVLDRIAADVHVLITDQNTGSGGDKYQLIFFGQNGFKQKTDTIYFDNAANNTDFEERDLLLKYLKLGLTPFITKTDMARNISIQMKSDKVAGDLTKDTTLNKKDPWNYWVFQANINGSINAEEVYKSSSLNGDFSANRVTEELRIQFSFNGGRSKSVYEFEDNNGVFQKLTIRNDNYDASHILIKSLTHHWSWGYELRLSRNSFSNIKYQPVFRTGIEYNIFPYKQVNTKYFTIGYILDFRRNNYFDTTLFDKTKENLAGHTLQTKLTINQKWGTIRLGAEYRNYFNNWKYLNLETNADLNIRISGGLSVFLYTSAMLIRDQIFLPKQGASAQDVLARRRQIATGYQVFTHFGISYRFGSQLNNFVNPRFGF